MGTPAKPKAPIRGTSKTRYPSDKQQVTFSNAECKALSKKENGTKVLAQKPKETVKEIRQAPNKNVELIRKLNNINDVLTKSTKNSTTKELKPEKNVKEKTKNESKIPVRTTSRCTNNKFSWHDILLNTKNEKNIAQQNDDDDDDGDDDDDVSSGRMILERELSGLDKFKRKESISSKYDSQSVKSQESQISKGSAIESLNEEFENIFESLKHNASSDEKVFLELRRQEFEMIYFKMANAVQRTKTPRKCLLQTVGILESKKTENETYDSDDDNDNDNNDNDGVDIYRPLSIMQQDLFLPDYASPKTEDSLLNLLNKTKKSTEVNRETVEVKDMSSISLIEDESVHLEVHLKENAQNRNLSQLKADLLSTESTQILQEENLSDEDSFVEINFEMEGFQSSEENCAQSFLEIDEAQIEDDESVIDIRSINSMQTDKKVKIKSNDINVGSFSDSESKVDFDDLRYSKHETDRFDVNIKSADSSHSTFRTKNSIEIAVQEEDLKKHDSKEVVQETKKDGQFEIISGFSQILLTALQTKPLYNKHDIIQSERNSLSEWTVLHEGNYQQKTDNLETDKHYTEKDTNQDNVESDNEQIDSNLIPSTTDLTSIPMTSNIDAVIEAVEENNSSENLKKATSRISKREIIETILRELKGTDISVSSSDFSQDLFLPTSEISVHNYPTSANESEDVSVESKISNENLKEIDKTQGEKEVAITNEIENFVSQNESPSDNSSQLTQSSSQHEDAKEILTSSVEEVEEQRELSQFAAQNWIKEFLHRMSKTFELSANEQQSTEKLELQKSKSNFSSEDDYTVANQQNDSEAEVAVEVFQKQSDTQLLIQQLEYNIEQIRAGLTELSRACDNELKKFPRQRPRLLPIEIQRRLSFTNGSEMDLSVNNKPTMHNYKPLECNVRCVCHTNMNAYDRSMERFDYKAESSANFNELPSPPNQSHAVNCAQSGRTTNDISVQVSSNAFIKPRCLTDEEFLKCSTDIKENNDRGNVDSFNLLKSIEAKENKKVVWSERENNICEDLEKVYKTCSRKFTKVQDQKSSKNAELELPTYDGCPCMLPTYKYIVQQLLDKTQNS